MQLAHVVLVDKKLLHFMLSHNLESILRLAGFSGRQTGRLGVYLWSNKPDVEVTLSMVWPTPNKRYTIALRKGLIDHTDYLLNFIDKWTLSNRVSDTELTRWANTLITRVEIFDQLESH